MNINITEVEALEHHIHSYLEDLTILKNKITAFFGVLKRDLKEIAINKKEIDESLKTFISQIEKVFDEVSTHRGSHHHKGMKFMDGNLLEAQNAQLMLKMFAENASLEKIMKI